ncbi:hypothetical protein PCI56_12320 [Plesiomonas shigelloides subsp. oncorhynchi]|nr:hypothetical protein [Plesiomonas shigelloides]
MGYERKRGKLAALNAFLLGQDPDAFDVIAGRRAVLSNIRYVITLISTPSCRPVVPFS